jgi:hypothetical protein
MTRLLLMGGLSLAAWLTAGSSAAAETCPAFDLEHQVSFWTGDWQLVEHVERCPGGKGYLYARKGREIRKLASFREVLALVPAVRNEVEALALAGFLSDNHRYLSDYGCATLSPQLTPRPNEPSKPPRPTTFDTERVPLVGVSGPMAGETRVDPREISVSRKGETGPFVVERFVRCPVEGQKLLRLRETFGPKGAYERKPLQVVSEEARP